MADELAQDSMQNTGDICSPILIDDSIEYMNCKYLVWI